MIAARLLRVLRLAAPLALLLALAGVARAQGEAARVRVRGSGAAAIERAVGRALGQHGIRVVKGRRKPAALRVDGRVRPSRSGRDRVTVELTVKRGAEVLGSLTVRAASTRAAARKVERELWAEVQGALAAAPPPAAEPAPPPPPRERKPRRRRVARAAPVEPEPTMDFAPDASVRTSAPEPESEGAHPWLRVAVGPELYARHFSYKDDVFDALREYDLGGTPALTAAAEAYPLATRRRDALAGLGAAARFTLVPDFDSEDAGGAAYTSEARAWSVGARYRLHVASAELAGALDLGSQAFSIAPVDDAPDPDFPAVRYRYLRAGLSGAAPLWSRYSIAAALGYRQVLSSGQIESDDFFPNASARGLDAELEIVAALGWGFDVRAGAAYERYGFALDPEPGDERVAGGALDQYLRFSLRVGFAY